jgi:hypothetical protein
MHCYFCGNKMPFAAKECPSCGRAKSRLRFVPVWGVIGGVVGSLIGFTAYHTEGALAGGLLGILLAETAGRLAFRAR